MGRVDRIIRFHSWLTSYGMSELDIEWFRTNPQAPDVLGLDYYPHSDWQLEMDGARFVSVAPTVPLASMAMATAYYNRYGIPLMLTETSVEGKPINREIWLDTMLDHIRRLRQEGVPMLGLIWWPMIDQLDWDGALTHRIGKIHKVGIVLSESSERRNTAAQSQRHWSSKFKEPWRAVKTELGSWRASPLRRNRTMSSFRRWANGIPSTRFEARPLK